MAGREGVQHADSDAGWRLETPCSSLRGMHIHDGSMWDIAAWPGSQARVGAAPAPPGLGPVAVSEGLCWGVT